MRNRGFVVKRDSVYLGELVKPLEFVVYDEYNKDIDGTLDLCCYSPLRAILFAIDEEKKSNDLLYKFPAYPIVGVTDDKIVTNSEFVINDSCNLSELLKYLGYDEELSYKDLKQLCEILYSEEFINGKWEQVGIKVVGAKNLSSNESFADLMYTIRKSRNFAYEKFFDGDKKKKNVFKPTFAEYKSLLKKK